MAQPYPKEFRDDVIRAALQLGALAVSSSQKKLWDYRPPSDRAGSQEPPATKDFQ